MGKKCCKRRPPCKDCPKLGKKKKGECYGHRLFLPDFEIISRRKTANLAIAGVLENTPGHCPEDARNAPALA